MRTDIIVSSSGRKLGKTLLAESICRRLSGFGIPVAFVKLSRGTHGAPGLHSGPGRSGSDTARCSSSGAVAASMYRYTDPEELPAVIDGLAAGAEVVIWESGTVSRFLQPDLYIHIRDREAPVRVGERSKGSVPDLTVRGPLDGGSASRVAAMVPGMLGLPIPSPFRVGGKHWLNLDGLHLLGEGRIRLLRAVRETGSILGAAKSTGISYKRAWLLIRMTEETLGADLVSSGRGGVGGGGSRLTGLADWLLELWERSEKMFNEMLDGLEV